MQTVIKNPNWWRRRTTLERCLTLLSVFALAAAIGLAIGLVYVILTTPGTGDDGEMHKPPPAEALHGVSCSKSNKVSDTKKKGSDSSNPNIEYCMTKDCIRAASDVISRMKLEVEPCDDFYRFACGTYLDEEMIPEDKVGVNTFSLISDKLQEQLREIITEERPATDPMHFRLPNALYKACMNKSLIEDLGATPIKTISDSLGGWPVIMGEAWNADGKWTWYDTVQKFRHLGFSMDYILDFSITVDLKNSTKRIIDLDQAAIGLSREYLVNGFNETLVRAYYEYMVDIAVLFGADKDKATLELRESLQFEMDLANISLPSEKRRNSNDLYNLRSLKEIQEAYPYVQWVEYMNGLLPSGLTIDETEIINLSVPSFFEDLGQLLKRTPNRIIANYMMWRIHAFSVAFLSENFRKRQLLYAKELSGRQEQEPRWKECVDISAGSDEEEEWEEENRKEDDMIFDDDTLGISVGSLYVRKHFKEDSKTEALEMVNNIRDVFSEILDEITWMDSLTKAEAQRKLHAMIAHIGYPDEMLDNDKLADYYKNLDINPDKYLASFLNMNIFGTDYSFTKLRQPVNKTDWIRHARPAIVNAFYSSIENSIQFPAGILQGHFFNSERPKYMNYGAIGYVIGHEITHGFDDQGRQFDVEGNLLDWWQPDTQKAYLDKARCIIDQYGNYTEPTTKMNLNGINTQGENIADNGGVKESYRAYQKWVSEHGSEKRLPGLNYTSEQMFWISAAQTWCSKNRKESLKMRITTGVHSPSEFRVLGAFSNMKDFSKDFQCPEGTPMNPVHKCEVW